MDEIARHSMLRKEKVTALYQWIGALMKYLPLRKTIYDFLKELRQNINQVCCCIVYFTGLGSVTPYIGVYFITHTSL